MDIKKCLNQLKAIPTGLIKYLRRTQTINDTRIKYIKIDKTDKLYEVEKISFYDFSIKAVETDLNISDVPEEEIFDISLFKDFRVTLKNKGVGKIIKFPGS